jgi:hypothetical protein
MRYLHQVGCSDEFTDIPKNNRVGERFDVHHDRYEKNKPCNKPVKLFVLHYFLVKLGQMGEKTGSI